MRQVDRLLGREWPEGGPPPPGDYDRRTAHAEQLEANLTDARRGHMEVVRTGVTLERLAQDWLTWGEHERGWKHSTLVALDALAEALRERRASAIPAHPKLGFRR